MAGFMKMRMSGDRLAIVIFVQGLVIIVLGVGALVSTFNANRSRDRIDRHQEMLDSHEATLKVLEARSDVAPQPDWEGLAELVRMCQGSVDIQVGDIRIKSVPERVRDPDVPTYEIDLQKGWNGTHEEKGR